MLSIGMLVACGDDDAATSSDEEPSGFEITGSWEGQPRQEGLPPLQVNATIRDLDDPSKNTVSYAGGIDCSGNWTYLGREGKAYRFREVIDRGAGDACKGAGVVILTPFDLDGVDYEFRGGGVESFGVLNRAQSEQAGGS
jgi:hypothetical protein